MISSIIYFCAFFGVCLFALCVDREFLRGLWNAVLQKKGVIPVLLLAVLADVAFQAWCVRRNQYIYHTDYAGYWQHAIYQMYFFFSHPFPETLLRLYYSINQADYNLLLPSVIAGCMKLFGYSFYRYVLINYILFFIPSCFVLGLTAVKLGGKNNAAVVFPAAVIIALLFPLAYYPTFHGYIDVAFLLPMSLSVFLLADYDFERIDIRRNISIAAMLVLCLLSRRYTAYYVVGYVAAFLLMAVFTFQRLKEKSLFRTVCLNTIMIGGVNAVLLLPFSQFVLHAFTTDYGDMYSAYDAPMPEKIALLTSTIGYSLLLTAALAGAVCFRKKRNRAFYASMAALVLVETLLFWRTQNMGDHHRLLLIVPLYNMTALLVPGCYTPSRKRGERNYMIAAIVCSVLLVLNFAKAFFPAIPENGTGTWFSSRYEPLYREDIEQVKKLCDDLNELTRDTDDSIYVLSSGDIMNADMLRKSNLPSLETAVNNLISSNEIDLRDGFPAEFLSAYYIVTTSPVDVHLKDGQEIVRYLAELVQDGDSCLGRHYTEIKSYPLDKGVQAKIYLRTDELKEQDLLPVKAYFSTLYPGRETLFGDRIDAWISGNCAN